MNYKQILKARKGFCYRVFGALVKNTQETTLPICFALVGSRRSCDLGPSNELRLSISFWLLLSAGSGALSRPLGPTLCVSVCKFLLTSSLSVALPQMAEFLWSAVVPPRGNND